MKSIKEIALQPSTVRTTLALLAVFSASFVIYASLVPLKYTPLDWPETIQRFREIPWLNLKLFNRADWVANGLIMIPAGFFACGAVDWRRASRTPLFLLSPLIAVALMAIVVAIEFVQIWFPPRVVSQNDIFAGLLGSVGGVLLWWLFGTKLLARVEDFVASPPGVARWGIAMDFAMLGLCLFNLMPLDLVLSGSEVAAKAARGGYRLFDVSLSLGSLLQIAIAGLRVAPYTFLATLLHGKSKAIRTGLLWAVMLEIVKLPVYSRAVAASDILWSAIGVLLTAQIARTCWRAVPKLDVAWMWCLAWLAWSGVLLVGFLGRFQHIVRDAETLQLRLREIFTVPFARAHTSSEFQAGENILLKMCVFALLTFLLAGWHSRIPSLAGKRFAAAFALIWVLVLGVGIELSQVFLFPLFPDATDLLLYAVGAVAGVFAFRLLIPAQQALAAQLGVYLHAGESSSSS